MPHDRDEVESLEDEFGDDSSMPGTHRGRVALAFGLIILVVIVGFLVWFIASNATRIRS